MKTAVVLPECANPRFALLRSSEGGKQSDIFFETSMMLDDILIFGLARQYRSISRNHVIAANATKVRLHQRHAGFITDCGRG